MENAPPPVDEQKPRASTGWGGARPGAGRKKDTGKADDYSRLAKARADHEELKAALRDLEVKQKTGELLPRDEVARAWSEQIAIAKGRLLSLPARVSADVLRLKTQREIERVLKAALVTILEELAGEAARYGLDREGTP
jgi:hypothetical protein